MNHLIATLSAEGASNWEICKRSRLWGTPAKSSHAKHAVKVAQAGDRLFVWQSGVGLIASATLAGELFEFRSVAEVPWPDPELYRFGVRLADIGELPEPVFDPFDGYVSHRFGVQTHQLQAGFAVLRHDQAQALSEAVDGTAPTPASAEPGDPEPRRQSETVVVAERPAVAAAYLQPSSSIVEALLALYRQNRLAVESGELILIGPAALRPEFEAERRKPPFDELGDRVQFVTPDELERRLRALAP